MKALFTALFALILLALIGVGASAFFRANQLTQDAYFAPKEESVRRNTFEHSKAFVSGTIQEIRSMQLDYVKATEPAQKAALASIIRHDAANIDNNLLPDDLRTFIDSLPQ